MYGVICAATTVAVVVDVGDDGVRAEDGVVGVPGVIGGGVATAVVVVTIVEQTGDIEASRHKSTVDGEQDV